MAAAPSAAPPSASSAGCGAAAPSAAPAPLIIQQFAVSPVAIRMKMIEMCFSEMLPEFQRHATKIKSYRAYLRTTRGVHMSIFPSFTRLVSFFPSEDVEGQVDLHHRQKHMAFFVTLDEIKRNKETFEDCHADLIDVLQRYDPATQLVWHFACPFDDEHSAFNMYITEMNAGGLPPAPPAGGNPSAPPAAGFPPAPPAVLTSRSAKRRMARKRAEKMQAEKRNILPPPSAELHERVMEMLFTEPGEV